jgi:hypothetical protein
VVHALERLQNQGDDQTGQFLVSIMRFQFIIALVIAEHILHSTVYLSTFLQDTDLQRNSPILFWRFRGAIGFGSLSTTSPGHTIRYIKRFG